MSGLNRRITRGLTILMAVGIQNSLAQTPLASPGSFPSKPIHWIVAGAPGTSPDVLAHTVSQPLSERLRQPVIVENRTGGFGNIAMEAAAHAAPDGYTIFLAIPTVVINPFLYKLSVDPLTDLTAVAQLTTVTFVLLANPSFPPQTVQEVLAAAKVRPGAVTCGWGGPIPQLACERLKAQGQVDIITVPYKGNAQAMTDLVGGQVKLLFDVVNVAIPQVKSNRVRAIATTNLRRGSGPFGHLPTINETLPGFEFEGWQGVLAPARTAREIIHRLNHEIGLVLQEDATRKRITDGGLEIAYGSPEAFTEAIRRDYANASKIIREAGIKPE